MKDQQYDFTLIDNTYSANDAREVITSLLTDKIRFLNVQILSIHERYGHRAEHLEKRVRQLEADKQRMISLLTDCTKNGAEVEISSVVKLTLKQPSKVNAQ
jgi:hypothetical protein